MAKKFLVDVDLNQLELQNAVIQNLASDPSTGVKGQIYFNTASNKYRFYDGSAWKPISEGAGSVTSVGVSNATDGGLSVSGSPITSSGTISVGHSNVLSSAQTTQALYPIKWDKNGHITGAGTAVDMSTYAKLASPAFTGTPTAPTAAAGTNTTQIATTAFVQSAITALPEPMIFKGSLGTGGTITTLPTASSANEGWTYKVITAGTYAGQTAKVGDTFISDGSTWVLIPSGDEPSGTVTSVGVQNATNGGLTVSGSPVTSSGTITVGHSNTLSSAQTTQAVYPIKYDINGHITGAGSAVTILKKYSTTITGNGTATTFTVTHSLGSRDVIIQVYDNSTYEEVIVDITRTSTSTATIGFAKAPTSSNSYRVVCIG